MRTYQYDLEDTLFFHGKFEFFIDQLKTSTVQTLTQKRDLIYSKDPVYRDMRKKNINRTIAEPYYTIISHIQMKEASIGMLWEIYNVSSLVKIYNKKKDAMRYWRNKRGSR